MVGFDSVRTERCSDSRQPGLMSERGVLLRYRMVLAASTIFATPTWAQARRIQLDDLS
jgi:hypothetical protein